MRTWIGRASGPITVTEKREFKDLIREKVAACLKGEFIEADNITVAWHNPGLPVLVTIKPLHGAPVFFFVDVKENT
jgi:hypothetical protein